ncbi:hypothetical protein PV04_08379 [Phialophora macrospora]|uniref:Zn(2)-C6 fungal-type domain-containing protein n=1 Tax=Phialophora macrospora TaxID=1851006 RepID=A0A0D2FDQ9_9EURO|nr:hypothetical protein PV04_08379 [Phialophora macrospora]
MAGRRKRPHVPEESRKRVARACDTCRRLKEKCEGGDPCKRCARLQRICEFIDNPRTTEASPDNDQMSEEFLDAERIRALEDIVRHYTGSASFDKPRLVRLAVSLENQPTTSANRPSSTPPGASPLSRHEDFIIEPVSATTAIYTGGLSHREFSFHVQSKLNEGLHDAQHDAQSAPKGTDLSRASRLHTEAVTMNNAAAVLPPPDVAKFLVQVFFEYAQTNYSYVDEQSLRGKLDDFFSGSMPRPLGAQDAPWLCALLMVFAIATQFAHLSSKTGPDESSVPKHVNQEPSMSPEDGAGLTFYHAAICLIPDVMSCASIDSVQAFLLLGVYTLPIDAAGLSFTYFGIAIKMAVQNGMHRNYHRGMDARTVELRNRIWWTAYTLEKRVCVLHGLPVSISKSDVDAAQPSDFPALRPKDRIDTLPNILAMIRLTAILEDARDTMSQIRKASKKPGVSILTSISKLKQSLLEYWEALPTTTYCRDLTPGGALFRFNVHLALTYHLARVFIGRSLIFDSPNATIQSRTAESDAPQWPQLRNSLVASCVQSALDIIGLCQLLQDEAGLARASYTEFTTCRAALLVILAHRISDRSTRLRKVSEQGMDLLKHMSLGFYAADAEKAAIEAMETAIRRLDDESHHNPAKSGASGSATSAYDQFRSWALLWRNEGSGDATSVGSHASAINPNVAVTADPLNFTTLSPLQSFGWDINSPSFAFEFGDNFTLPSGDVL